MPGGEGGGSFTVTAPYQVEIEKYYNGEYWVNRYYVNGASLDDAVSAGAQIYAVERPLHGSNITFTKMSVRTTAKGDYIYQTTVLNTMGTNANSGSEMMPLFVVLRVDLGVAGSKPSRKYYRGVLRENDVSAMTITSTSGFNTLVGALANIAALCDPQGQDIISAVASPNVGMRQLRRGSKKKSTLLSGGTPV